MFKIETAYVLLVLLSRCLNASNPKNDSREQGHHWGYRNPDQNILPQKWSQLFEHCIKNFF